MATDVILPRVDMDMTTGRISHWYVKAGESVEKGQPLFEIETDKAAMEIEAPATGRVQIVVNIGAQVPVGSTVGWILAEGEADVGAASGPDLTPDAAPSVADLATAEAPVASTVAITDGVSAPASAPSEIRATPLSRRLAAQHGLDLAAIPGSGPKGRVQAEDVTAAAAKVGSSSDTSSGFLNGAWLRQGSGDPIVMIHGFGSDLGGWRPFVQGLPATLPIYALDLPGHGCSTLGDVKDIGDVVARVISSLKEAGITGGHLVGHSLGGAVAALVMAGGDFQAKSLFLIAPGGLGPEVNAGFIHGFAGAATEAALGVWMSELVEDPAVMTPALVKATAKARAGTAIPESQAKLAAALFPGAAQGFSVLSALKAPSVPTRVVFGRADRIIPASHAQRLSGVIAVHLFAGVGHLPHYEVRDAVAALLLQHMKSAG
jgi:pyruvate dehydrogenase E2 component (dihydrolipoamide acetyltransferase)